MFDSLFEQIEEFLRSSILETLSGMFASVNSKVGEIATDVGMTPESWKISYKG